MGTKRHIEVCRGSLGSKRVLKGPDESVGTHYDLNKIL